MENKEIKTGELIGGKFKVLSKIGAGSFGAIFLVRDIDSKRKFAIKLEHSDAQFPLLLYEANVSIMLAQHLE